VCSARGGGVYIYIKDRGLQHKFINDYVDEYATKKAGIFLVGKGQSALEKGICLLNSVNYERIESFNNFNMSV
jgi:hypothetical protein